MLKKSRTVGEDEEEESNRHSSKFGELGSRVERIFRAAFSKKNSSQNQLNKKLESTDSDIEHPQDNKPVSVERRSSVEKLQNLDNSDVSSEVDIGIRTNLVILKKHNQEIADGEKIQQQSSTVRKMRQLKRSQHVHSNDLEPTSMDVVADIHCENPQKSAERIEEDIVEILSESELDNNLATESPPTNYRVSADVSFDNSVDSTKKQRKRWSKEAGIIKLPTRHSVSSAASARSSSWRSLNDEDTVVPVPAPRLNRIVNLEESDSDRGHSNAAFESDHGEEILKIETEYGARQQTKIEIKSLSNDITSLEFSPRDFLVSAQNLSYTAFTEDITESEKKRVKKFASESKPIAEHTEYSPSSENGETSLKKPKVQKVRKKSSGSSESEDYSTEETRGSLSDIPRAKPRKSAKAKIRDTVTSTDEDKDTRTMKIKKETLEHRIQSLSPSRTQSDVKREKSSSKGKRTKKRKEKLKFICVKIHKADMLEADYVTRHPMVIVHIVEATTGNYVKLDESTKNEKQYLQPLISGTFDFKENKSMIPYWDEELIFEYDFNSLFTSDDNHQILILFEIVDLLSFAEASYSYDQFGGENCWYKIAWAFLKPLGHKGVSHTDREVRLQLYKPKRTIRKKIKHRCEAYSWWKSGARDKYPSTLYVVVTSVDPPKLEPVFYGHVIVDDTIVKDSGELCKATNATLENAALVTMPKWSRLAAQSCKIPNELFFETEITENGCFYVLFSNNGTYLACANAEEYDYPIVIYKIDEMKVFAKFVGHKGFVYSLDWSPTDDLLLSVSSDQTARLWDVKNKLMHNVYMLPHPSYVYCGKFDPSLNGQIIATGCYDHVARIWIRSDTSYELLQELEGHEGFVNSICYQKASTLLTADSVGVVIQWSLRRSRKRSRKEWTISKKIKIREIEGVPINTIILHPLGSRLLVHSRNNCLRMLDLATGIVLQRYDGLKNTRIQICTRISPCGGLLLCGGEDGTLNIWSVESGKHVAVYYLSSRNLAVTCVDYHPYDHALAYATFGTSSPVVVLRFNKSSTGEKVGLKLFNEEDQEFSVKSAPIAPSKPPISRRFSDFSTKSQKNGFNSDDLTYVSDGGGNRDELRRRLKAFNETEGQLKTKSANRLTSIIAKIDRILSNNNVNNINNSRNNVPRMSYDVEANKLGSSVEEIPRAIPHVPPLFSNFENNSSDCKSTEAIEMVNFKRKPRTHRAKSRSAREVAVVKASEEELNKAFSDGAINFGEKKKKHREEVAAWTSFNGTTAKEIGEELSSAESGGTYVVDENKKSQEELIVESASSVRSDVTFIVEHEKPERPIPKPRRKRI